jgi:uridine phosphorylase
MIQRQIPESELILHPDGSIFHLRLLPEQLGNIVFTVGDPDRVATVSRHLDQIDFKLQNREFITHTGWKNGHHVSVISTGMGTDNIEILMTELDALVNVDLQTRQVKEKKTSLQIIRIGTSGSLQEDLPTGTLLASEIAIGMDTLMAYYPELSGPQDFGQAIQAELGLSFAPYQATASTKLLGMLDASIQRGVTLTCPGFYAPQGREVRLKPRFEQLIERLAALRVEGRYLTNFEMETAGYYAMGELLGHDVLSLNAILVNRPLKKFAADGEKTVEKAIQTALTTFAG